MTEFHFEDPDLKNSTLEIGFPNCAIEKDNFTDSQGKHFERKTKSLSSQSSETKAHLRCRCNRRPTC